MKRFFVVLSSVLVGLFLVSCSQPVQTVVYETSTPVESPWVEVVVDTEAMSGINCCGTNRLVVDARVTNPLATLVSENKVKLELVETKSSNNANRYFGTENSKAETIKVYKVFVNKNTVTDMDLEDTGLAYHMGSSGDKTYFYRITKVGNSWKMKSMSVGTNGCAGLDYNPIDIATRFYE